ncbi:MAG: hypothetical protein Q9221_003113 [Calogaya cf. arnoldii]
MATVTIRTPRASGWIFDTYWHTVDEPENKLFVTVLLVMGYEIDPWEWYGLDSKIAQLLLAYDLPDVLCEIERGENVRTRSSFPLYPPIQKKARELGEELRKELGDVLQGEYHVEVGLGSDVGPARYFEKEMGEMIPGPSGTIGGIVDVVGAGGERKKMALTCYHIMRDVFDGIGFTASAEGRAVREEVVDGSEVDAIDRNGRNTGSPPRKDTLLESPSRRKHNYTMQDLANDIEIIGGEHDKKTNPAAKQRIHNELACMQEEFDTKKQFFDDSKQILGRPWLASGFMSRTSYNGRLDWALIEFDDDNRIGNNMIPPREHWPNQRGSPDIAGFNLQGVISCQDETAQKEKIFKVGARTCITACKHSALLADCRFPDDARLGLKFSSEHCFVYSSIESYGTAPVNCGQRGDSGAFVWTEDGMLLGQLFGGLQTETLTLGSVSYVTDAEEIFRSMNEVAGGEFEISLATNQDGGNGGVEGQVYSGLILYRGF